MSRKTPVQTVTGRIPHQGPRRRDARSTFDKPKPDGRPATIVLADDHTVVRRGLRTLLEEAGFEIAAEAGDTATALRKVGAYKPDVLVLDLSMPGGSSLQAIPTVVEKSPRTAIVVLTMHDDTEFARAALRNGASGFVVKEAADSELLEAVQEALNGHEYVSTRLGAKIAAEPLPRPLDGLTDRELEVLRLVALGYTNKEIALQLRLSDRTIESHRARIQHKIGRFSRVELVAYARERDLITGSRHDNGPSTSWPAIQAGLPR
jgi:two-component system, NarL family, response regulator NreC